MPGTLHLLPNLLGDQADPQASLPASVFALVPTLDGLIAESETAARRFLSHFDLGERQARQVPVAVMRDESDVSEVNFLLEPVEQGQNWGLLSDAGLPCIADPGSRVVRRARQMNLPIEAHVGPSSILLALMLSGMRSQAFSFHGYLDKQPEARKKQVQTLENRSREEGMTQIAIEAPFRNAHTLETLVETLSDDTQLAVAWNLTLPDQQVLSRKVGDWRVKKWPDLSKVPAVFVWRAADGQAARSTPSRRSHKKGGRGR